MLHSPGGFVISRIAVALCALVVATPAVARCKNGANVSWYGEPQRVSDGSRYNPEGATCASRSAPRGSLLKITLDDGRSAQCTVNDYGPAAWTGCLVDASRRIGRELGILDRGTAKGSVVVLRRGPALPWALQERWPAPVRYVDAADGKKTRR